MLIGRGVMVATYVSLVIKVVHDPKLFGFVVIAPRFMAP